MPMRSPLNVPIALLVLQFAHLSASDTFEPDSASHFVDHVRPLMERLCADCHDDETDGPKLLAAKTAVDLQKDRELWTSVAMQLRNRTMPPADEQQPTEQERLEVSTWIDEHLRSTACDGKPFAGHVTIRRLNRFEYDHTLQDLLGLDMRFRESFPVDGSGGEGFDNNGETLFLPPILLERYLESAQQILDRVIVTPPLDETFAKDQFLPSASEKVVDGRRLVDPGEEITCLVNVFTEGDYDLHTNVQACLEGDARIQLKVDGVATRRMKIDHAPEGNNDAPDRSHRTRVRLTRGLHAISLQNETNSPSIYVNSVVAQTQPGKAPSREKLSLHHRLFPDNVPNDPKAQRTLAHIIVREFAGRAFRRDVTSAEMKTLITLYDRAARRNDPFAERVKLVLKSVLVSPKFLFLVEDQTLGEPTDGIARLADTVIATRLSFFLWASCPDEELLQLAKAGRLQDERVLNEQVTRMLASDKAKRFAEDFVGQWLGTREVGGRKIPSVEKFKSDEYQTELAIDFRQEAVEAMHYILANDRSVMEFIDADYVFVNKRLAKQYGMKELDGQSFRKISVENEQRGGVLGLGGVHLLTSHPDRTSPVLRGAWVLETLLGVKVPNPPPDIPDLNVKSKQAKKMTIRATLEAHRNNPTCAACHGLIDPIGFGLDNYDVLGRWREKQNGSDIDPAGKMPTGEEFSGPKELKAVLLDRRDEFVRQLTRKMLGYALGRSLEDGDGCTIEKLVQQVADNDYRIQSLVRGVVLSTPFRYSQVEKQ